MSDNIETEIYTEAKKNLISTYRIEEIYKLINYQIDREKICYFVTKTTDSYKLQLDIELKNLPVQVDILTNKYLFELWFGEDDVKFDKTDINLLGIPEIIHTKNIVQLTFGMVTPNRMTRIVTLNKDKIRDLYVFFNAYTKLIFAD